MGGEWKDLLGAPGLDFETRDESMLEKRIHGVRVRSGGARTRNLLAFSRGGRRGRRGRQGDLCGFGDRAAADLEDGNVVLLAC
jgi:hypothetical protein